MFPKVIKSSTWRNAGWSRKRGFQSGKTSWPCQTRSPTVCGIVILTDNACGCLVFAVTGRSCRKQQQIRNSMSASTFSLGIDHQTNGQCCLCSYFVLAPKGSGLGLPTLAPTCQCVCLLSPPSIGARSKRDLRSLAQAGYNFLKNTCAY